MRSICWLSSPAYAARAQGDAAIERGMSVMLPVGTVPLPERIARSEGAGTCEEAGAVAPRPGHRFQTSLVAFIAEG